MAKKIVPQLTPIGSRAGKSELIWLIKTVAVGFVVIVVVIVAIGFAAFKMGIPMEPVYYSRYTCDSGIEYFIDDRGGLIPHYQTADGDIFGCDKVDGAVYR